jgi:hypothetical protein
MSAAGYRDVGAEWLETMRLVMRTIANVRKLAPAAALSLASTLIAAASAQEAPSLMEVAVEVDLSPAFAAAETLVPRQTGGTRWRDWHGLKVRYQAWRGPLLMELRGDVLLVRAHVRYRAQGRKGLIGDLAISSGCGVDEPPRQALIGAAIRLAIAPDWSLRPTFRVLPTRFIDRCEITALDIDVSPLVERAFQKELREALEDALREVAPRLNGLRAGMARGWAALQDPRQLTPGLWLAARPEGLGIAPLLGQGQRLSTVIGIALRPVLSTSEPRAERKRPLPPLTLFRPMASGMRFEMVLDVALADLSAEVARRLSAQSVEVRDVLLTIDDVDLSVAGDRLVLVADIAGEVPGRLDVRGRPVLDEGSGAVRFADLDFAFDSTHPDTELILALFYERIRERLQQMADEALAEQMDAALKALQMRVNEWLSGHGWADFSKLQLTSLSVGLDDERIALRGQAKGKVRVVLE